MCLKQRGDDAHAHFAEADCNVGVVGVVAGCDIHVRYEPVDTGNSLPLTCH